MKLRIPLFISSIIVGLACVRAISVMTEDHFISQLAFFVPIVFLTLLFEKTSISNKVIPLPLGIFIILVGVVLDYFLGV